MASRPVAGSLGQAACLHNLHALHTVISHSFLRFRRSIGQCLADVVGISRVLLCEPGVSVWSELWLAEKPTPKRSDAWNKIFVLARSCTQSVV